MRKLTIILVLVLAAGSASAGKPGDLVLCSDYSLMFVPCKVKQVAGEQTTLVHTWGGVQHDITVPPPFVLPFDWKPGTSLACIEPGQGERAPRPTDGDDDNPLLKQIGQSVRAKPATIVSITGEKLHIRYTSRFTEEERKTLGVSAEDLAKMEKLGEADTTIQQCSVEREIDPSAYWMMSPIFRAFDSYKKRTALPKAGMKNAALAAAAASALSYDMPTWDGAKYVQIKKCVVTSSGWTNLSSGDTLEARYVNTACAVRPVEGPLHGPVRGLSPALPGRQPVRRLREPRARRIAAQPDRLQAHQVNAKRPPTSYTQCHGSLVDRRARSARVSCGRGRSALARGAGTRSREHVSRGRRARSGQARCHAEPWLHGARAVHAEESRHQRDDRPRGAYATARAAGRDTGGREVREGGGLFPGVADLSLAIDGWMAGIITGARCSIPGSRRSASAMRRCRMAR